MNQLRAILLERGITVGMGRRALALAPGDLLDGICSTARARGWFADV
jgi:hypothetical protein